MRHGRLALVTCTLSLLSAAEAAPAAAAACDRACLLQVMDRYVSALVAHDPSALPLAAGVKFTENGTRKTVGDGAWKTVTKLVARREVFADPASGNAAFWGVFDEGGSPLMLSIRLEVADEKITEIETVAARKGSHSLFGPDTFVAPAPEFQQPLPPAERVPRAKLVAAANGYFDGIEKSDHRLVPSAVGCNRYENGVRMTNRPGTPPVERACAMAVDRLGYIKAVRNRRYDVVDEERGVVLSTILFDIPADAAANPPREGRMLLLAELFKIVSGEITRIETVMHNLPYGASTGWEN